MKNQTFFAIFPSSVRKIDRYNCIFNIIRNNFNFDSASRKLRKHTFQIKIIMNIKKFCCIGPLVPLFPLYVVVKACVLMKLISWKN